MSWEREKFSFGFFYFHSMFSSSCKHGLAFLFISFLSTSGRQALLASLLGGNGKVMYFHFMSLDVLFFLVFFFGELVLFMYDHNAQPCIVFYFIFYPLISSSFSFFF